MTRFLALVALLAVSAAPAAQDFPAPGTGLLTFEPIGDRALNAYSFAFAGDGTLFAYADSLFRFETDPAGPPAGHWTTLTRPSTVIEAVVIIGPNADTVLVGRSSTTFRSTDGGVTWAVVNGGVPGVLGGPSEPDAFAALPADHPHAGRLLAGGGILHSDDRGASWTQATRSFPGEQGNAYAFTALPSGRVLMAGSWGVAASDDGGGSYAVTPLWGDYAVETHTITALATPGSRQTGVPACDLPDTTLCDGAVVAGISVTAPHMQVWRTSDGGRTWSEPVSLSEPYDGVGAGYPASVVALPPRADGFGRALLIGRRGVVFRTLDGGVSWEAIARLPIRPVVNGSPSHRVKLARVGPDGHLWVATLLNGSSDEWLYRSAEPVEAAFAVIGEATPPPSGLHLDVQPNPSGGRMAVRLTLPSPSALAAVGVFDVLGRRVAVLHDGPLAAGASSFALDTTRWAAGTYVVRARAGDASAIARFTVTR